MFTITITPEALEQIHLHMQPLPHLETGGLLIGRYEGKGHFIITRATGAGDHAAHTPHGFMPAVAYYQGYVQALLDMQSPEIRLGQWHSHPSGMLIASGLDMRTCQKLAREEHAPVMLIVGTPNGRLEAAAYVGLPDGVYVATILS